MRYALWTGIVAVFLAPGVASASYVNAKLTSVNPGVNMTIYESSTYSGGVGTTAGSFNWTQSDNGYLQNSFKTFCIEIGQPVSIGGTYEYRLDNRLHNYPSPGNGAGGTNGSASTGGMGTTKANLIRELYGRYYDTLGSSNVNNAAFQLAIWEITHDGYVQGNYYSDDVLSIGDFRMTTTTGDAGLAKNLANRWLDSLNGQGPMNGSLVVLTSPTAQDQITVAVAPAPPAIGLAVVGAIALFGLKRSRRKAEPLSPSPE